MVGSGSYPAGRVHNRNPRAVLFNFSFHNPFYHFRLTVRSDSRHYLNPNLRRRAVTPGDRSAADRRWSGAASTPPAGSITANLVRCFLIFLSIIIFTISSHFKKRFPASLYPDRRRRAATPGERSSGDRKWSGAVPLCPGRVHNRNPRAVFFSILFHLPELFYRLLSAPRRTGPLSPGHCYMRLPPRRPSP